MALSPFRPGIYAGLGGSTIELLFSLVHEASRSPA